MSEFTPPQPEQQPFQHPEMIRYDDGQLAIGFRTPGDKIEWGRHKYASPEASIDRILVGTSSGNVYAVGSGVIINKNRSVAHDIHELPEGLPDITVGESWVIPGYGHTTSVETVLLRYKVDQRTEGYDHGGPNPFDKVEPLIEQASEHFDGQYRQQQAGH